MTVPSSSRGDGEPIHGDPVRRGAFSRRRFLRLGALAGAGLAIGVSLTSAASDRVTVEELRRQLGDQIPGIVRGTAIRLGCRPADVIELARQGRLKRRDLAGCSCGSKTRCGAHSAGDHAMRIVAHRMLGNPGAQ